MGNAQTQHVSSAEIAGGRKKSRSGDDNFRFEDGSMRPRTSSAGSRGQQHLYDDPMVMGPVDITARVQQKTPSSSSGNNNQNATTPYRPRATTEVGGRRPQNRQQMSVDSAAAKSSLTAAAAAAAALADPNDKDALKERSEGGKKKMPTIFKFSAGKEAKDVFVAGSFNNWSKMRMNRSTKDFIAIVDLQEGEHEYRKDKFDKMNFDLINLFMIVYFVLSIRNQSFFIKD